MPSLTVSCPVCDKETTMNTICAHFMTHKDKLVPFLMMNTDKFATVWKEGGVEDSKVFCCFGCKKAFKNRKSVREHIQLEEHSQKNHEQFLKDIGFNVQKQFELRLQTDENKAYKKLSDENEALRQQLAERDEGNIYSHRLQIAETELLKAQQQILRCEEALRCIPLVMQSRYIEYCREFEDKWRSLQGTVLPGQLVQEYRDQLLRILKTTPLLQMWFVPSYNFLMNHHFPNGEYNAILGGNYQTHFYYEPPTTIHGDIHTLPDLPDFNVKEQEKKMAQQFASEILPDIVPPPIKYSKTNKRPAKRTEC